MIKFPNKKPYDLEERTALPGEEVIDILKKLPNNLINKRMVPQLIASERAENVNPSQRCQDLLQYRSDAQENFKKIPKK